MLVLSRRRKQSIVIDTPVGPVTITVLGFAGRHEKVKLGIDAPDVLPVHRSELLEVLHAQGQTQLERRRP